jgi:hypothetical protein
LPNRDQETRGRLRTQEITLKTGGEMLKTRPDF